MPSTKPKIQLYLDKDVEPYLRNWLLERQFTSDSIGLNQLLREYFNIEKAEITSTDWKYLIGSEIQSALMPLAEKIANIDQRIFEIEAQFQQEREYPQPSLNQEAMESVWMQQEVIRQMQSEIDSLRESPGESPDNIPFTDEEPISIKELAEQGLEAIERDDEKIDDELEKLLGGIPELSIEHCAARLIQVLEAQFGALSKEELKEFPEQDLMGIIFAQNAGINIEQGEAVYQRVLAEIPANPPLSKILGDDEESIELNLEGDSLGESPKESPIELSHDELVIRLKTKTNTLRGQRNQPGFAAWAQQRDNQGLLWYWDRKRKTYQGFKPTPV